MYISVDYPTARYQTLIQKLTTTTNTSPLKHLQQQILNAKARHTYVAIMVVLFVLFTLSRNVINFLNLRSLTILTSTSPLLNIASAPI